MGTHFQDGLRTSKEEGLESQTGNLQWDDVWLAL